MRLISGSLVIFEGTVCMCDTDLCNTDVFETSGSVTGSVFQMLTPVMFGLMVASFSAY